MIAAQSLDEELQMTRFSIVVREEAMEIDGRIGCDAAGGDGERGRLEEMLESRIRVQRENFERSE